MRDVLRVYRALLPQSVLVAGLCYAAPILAIDALGYAGHATLWFIFLEILALWLVTLTAPFIVQGALIELVRALREGEHLPSLGTAVRVGRRRFWRLLGAGVVYGFGVGLGLVLLVLPGLVIAARWSLMAPLIVIEQRSVGEARARSAGLVRGSTGVLLVALIVSNVPGAVAPLLLPGGFVGFVLSTLVSTLFLPLTAHLLTVAYYGLAQPGLPVLADGR